MNQVSTEFRMRAVSGSQIADLIKLSDETGLSPWTAQNFFDELQTENSVMISLVDPDTELAGFLVGRIVPGAERSSNDAEVYNIAVRPELQGCGLGQRLFNEFLEKCALRLVANIWLEVRESNRKAIEFYTRNGFEPMRTRRDFYQNPRENAILMRLSLKKDTA